MRLYTVLSVLLIGAEAVAAPVCPYPNELPSFRLCATARWRALQPLVSTAADVRHVLGPPTSESDIAHYFDPYPGDARAQAPVLTFDGGPDWEILVYFVRTDSQSRESLVSSVHDKLLTIDLVPRRRRSFAAVAFPPIFQKQHVIAADAAWDEYADGSGLVYEVYSSKPDHGDERAGDLNRISYGASNELKAKYGKR